VIREEVKAASRISPVATDYYAQQANPKDGGYVKGVGIRIRRGDLEHVAINTTRTSIARGAAKGR